MKSIVDSYIGLWLIMLFLMLGIAFTTINLNVVQARKMYNDIKSQIQASNGIDVPSNGTYSYDSNTGETIYNQNGTDTKTTDSDGKRTLSKDGYTYTYTVERKKLTADSNILADNETWIYNDIYKISLNYEYTVPLFGKQTYPITGYTY